MSGGRRMKRTELLRRVLADCYCHLQPSPIRGIGVFAVCDIPKAKNPFRTLKKYATPGSVQVTDEELAHDCGDIVYFDVRPECYLPGYVHKPLATPEPADKG